MGQQDLFERIVTSLHDAALDDTHWLQASALIDEALQSAGNHLVFSGQTPAGVDILYTRFCYRGEHRTDLEAEYFSNDYPKDEHVPALRRLPDSKVVPITRLLTERQIKTSATYNEMMPRFQFQNGLNVRLDGPRESRIVWGIADPRNQGGWSSAQLAAIQRLLPHIRQFVCVRQALADERAFGLSLTALVDRTQVGVVHLDPHGKILYASDHARSIFQESQGLSDKGGYLRAWLPADNARLERLLADALPGPGLAPTAGSIAIPRPPGCSPLMLHVNPITPRQADFGASSPGALVFIVELQNRLKLDPGLVAAALGLTPAQSRITVLLAEGKTIGEIASTTGRRENTINTHLKKIHRKLGVSRRAELINLVHAIAKPPYAPALPQKPLTVAPKPGDTEPA